MVAPIRSAAQAVPLALAQAPAATPPVIPSAPAAAPAPRRSAAPAPAPAATPSPPVSSITIEEALSAISGMWVSEHDDREAWYLQNLGNSVAAEMEALAAESGKKIKNAKLLEAFATVRTPEEFRAAVYNFNNDKDNLKRGIAITADRVKELALEKEPEFLKISIEFCLKEIVDGDQSAYYQGELYRLLGSANRSASDKASLVPVVINALKTFRGDRDSLEIVVGGLASRFPWREKVYVSAEQFEAEESAGDVKEEEVDDIARRAVIANFKADYVAAGKVDGTVEDAQKALEKADEKGKAAAKLTLIGKVIEAEKAAKRKEDEAYAEYLKAEAEGDEEAASKAKEAYDKVWEELEDARNVTNSLVGEFVDQLINHFQGKNLATITVERIMRNKEKEALTRLESAERAADIKALQDGKADKSPVDTEILATGGYFETTSDEVGVPSSQIPTSGVKINFDGKWTKPGRHLYPKVTAELLWMGSSASPGFGDETSIFLFGSGPATKQKSDGLNGSYFNLGLGYSEEPDKVPEKTVPLYMVEFEAGLLESWPFTQGPVTARLGGNRFPLTTNILGARLTFDYAFNDNFQGGGYISAGRAIDSLSFNEGFKLGAEGMSMDNSFWIKLRDSRNEKASFLSAGLHHLMSPDSDASVGILLSGMTKFLDEKLEVQSNLAYYPEAPKSEGQSDASFLNFTTSALWTFKELDKLMLGGSFGMRNGTVVRKFSDDLLGAPIVSEPEDAVEETEFREVNAILKYGVTTFTVGYHSVPSGGGFGAGLSFKWNL